MKNSKKNTSESKKTKVKEAKENEKTKSLTSIKVFSPS